MILQVRALPVRPGPATWLRLGSLVFGGLGLGLRLARLGSPVVAAGVVAGVLALLGLLLGGVSLASRRRVTRARSSRLWVVGAASATVNVAAMMPPGSPPARRRIQMLTVTVLLQADRLVLVPVRSMARSGGLAELDLPFSRLRSASWLTGYDGVRHISTLQLTGASGDPVMIRFNGLGSRRASRDFVDAAKTALAPWLPVPAVTYSPTDLVNVPCPSSASVPLAAFALIMVVAIAGGYVAGAAIITNAHLVPSTNGWIRPQTAIGVTGYYTYGGQHGLPIQPGAPWGRACEPILVRVEESVPDAAYLTFVEVVHEARAEGIDITIATRNGDFAPSELYPPGQHLNTVRTADVFADNNPPTRLVTGAPDHDDRSWLAALSSDGHHEYLTYLGDKLHLSVLGVDATGYRKSALRFVGFTQGVGASTIPGSAFGADFAGAANTFSGRDISAMLAMSGCAATARATGVPA